MVYRNIKVWPTFSWPIPNFTATQVYSVDQSLPGIYDLSKDS